MTSKDLASGPCLPLQFYFILIIASDIQNYRLNSQAVTYLCAFLNISFCPEGTIVRGLPNSFSVKNTFPLRGPPGLSSLENLLSTPDSQAFRLGLESIPSRCSPPHQRQPSNYTTGFSGYLACRQKIVGLLSLQKSRTSSELKISIYKN